MVSFLMCAKVKIVSIKLGLLVQNNFPVDMGVKVLETKENAYLVLTQHAFLQILKLLQMKQKTLIAQFASSVAQEINQAFNLDANTSSMLSVYQRKYRRDGQAQESHFYS